MNECQSESLVLEKETNSRWREKRDVTYIQYLSGYAKIISWIEK